MRRRQNYAVIKDKKQQLRLAAGPISERFPSVFSIVLKMAYCHNGTEPILIRTVNFSPDDYAYFNMECLVKGCVKGGFDITPAVNSMIKSHKKSATGKLICKGKSDEFPSPHASIAYEVTVKYSQKH